MGGFKLKGYDAFSGEWYPLGDVKADGGGTIDGMKPEYETYAEALADARVRLADLERTQPTSSSGGQAAGGIQDRVYIVHPDGVQERVLILPPPGAPATAEEQYWRIM